MAKVLWGQVYLHDDLAGILQQEPAGAYRFTYDPAYLAAGKPPIAHTLPLRAAPYLSNAGLHPYFDNLLSEGWLRNAQARALGVSVDDRFSLLLAFGHDCAGAISIRDPDPPPNLRVDAEDYEAVAALSSRASLSGIQAKLMVVAAPAGYRPAGPAETSTHIAKLNSGQFPDLVELEYLTMTATKIILPEEEIPSLEIGSVGDIAKDALIVERFDRVPKGGKRHFEEFAQLLGLRSADKYEGNYADMARFIRATPECAPADAERLFRRIMTCLLLGNTDAHLKNFAMFHTPAGLRLAPQYDLVASAYYRQFQTVALAVATVRDLRIGDLDAKHIVAMTEDFGLSQATLDLALKDLGGRLDNAKASIEKSAVGTKGMRDGIIALMEKRWNGTFGLIGRRLSKKRAAAAKK
jgi:serine/threonine-protein kinase HipA